jgi:hypothetical protein
MFRTTAALIRFANAVVADDEAAGELRADQTFKPSSTGFGPFVGAELR